MLTTFPERWAVLAALLGTWLSQVPNAVHVAAGVALWFVVADLVTGVAAAHVRKRTSSSVFRKKMLSKFACYVGILMLAAGFGAIAANWHWPLMGWYAVIAAEGLSIGENLRVLLRTAGPTLQPVAALLEKILGLASLDSLGNGAKPKPGPEEPAAGGE